MKRIIEMRHEGKSIREIARTLCVARNTVRCYLRNPGIRHPAKRVKRTSLLEPFTRYIKERLAAGVFNCVVLLHELKAQEYTGGYTILKYFVKPFREIRQNMTDTRFDTAPGQQAQVDWSKVKYRTADEHT